MLDEISSYITRRYRYWKDYARYHSSLAGIPDLAEDLLHEVILNLINKDPDQLRRLYERRKGQYRELDFFVLNIIKRNAHSRTSPFWYSVIDRTPKDVNMDPQSMEILNEEYDYRPDHKERILDGIRLLRISLDWTFLQPLERSLVEMKVWDDKPITESSRILQISYQAGRDYYNSGIQKIRDTATHIRKLRRIHQN